jgi:hypothetical protein
MALQVRFAGQASRGVSCLFAQRRPVIVQRCFDADAETTSLTSRVNALPMARLLSPRPGPGPADPLRGHVAVKRGDRGHVIGIQVQVLGKQVAGQVLALGRGRDDRVAQLQRPRQRDLGHGGLVLAGDGASTGSFSTLP